MKNIYKMSKKTQLVWNFFCARRHLKFVYHAHETIAKECGCNRRSVIRAIQWLEERGYLTIDSGQMKHRSNIYVISTDEEIEHRQKHDTARRKYEQERKKRIKTVSTERPTTTDLPAFDGQSLEQSV